MGPVRIVGVDLAWGEKKPDGLAWIDVDLQLERGEPAGVCSSSGDDALVRAIEEMVPSSRPGLVALDGPILCRNWDGARPVDRETPRLYGHYHASCHPVVPRRACSPWKPPALSSAPPTTG